MLRGTGSDGEQLAPVLGKMQSGKCSHMSQGTCVSPPTITKQEWGWGGGDKLKIKHRV